MAQFDYAIPATQGLKPLRPEAIQHTSTVALERSLRTPYSQTWFLGFQRELTPNLVVEVNQVGSLARKLLTTDAINRGGSVLRTPENPHGFFHRGYGEIIYHGNQGHSNHLALQMTLSRRWSQGVQFQLSYTYARTKDVQSDPFILRMSGAARSDNLSSRLAASNLGAIPAFFQQFNPSAQYGSSDFDQKHNLVLNFVAQTPRLDGWRRVLSGWQMAGLIGIRSGYPFTVYSQPVQHPGERGVAQRADFFGEQRSKAFLPKRSPVSGGVLLLDQTQFRAPPEGQFGNLPRNALRGPGFWNTDVSISRSFALPWLGEQGQVQLRAELFNLFNHANLNNPDSVLQSGTFGQALFGRQGFGSALPSASPLDERPRRVQVAVKFYF